MSFKYIASGSPVFSPIAKAGVGEVDPPIDRDDHVVQERRLGNAQRADVLPGVLVESTNRVDVGDPDGVRLNRHAFGCVQRHATFATSHQHRGVRGPAAKEVS